MGQGEDADLGPRAPKGTWTVGHQWGSWRVERETLEGLEHESLECGAVEGLAWQAGHGNDMVTFQELLNELM